MPDIEELTWATILVVCACMLTAAVLFHLLEGERD